MDRENFFKKIPMLDEIECENCDDDDDEKWPKEVILESSTKQSDKPDNNDIDKKVQNKKQKSKRKKKKKHASPIDEKKLKNEKIEIDIDLKEESSKKRDEFLVYNEEMLETLAAKYHTKDKEVTTNLIFSLGI